MANSITMMTNLASCGRGCWLACVAMLLAGCDEWRHDVTEMGVSFTQVRTEANGLRIGRIKEDTEIAGCPCQHGWVHLHPNGMPAAFTAARDIERGDLRIPAGTWVFQNAAGVVTVCAFPRETEVQGWLCRGTGGPKGVQAAFYPDGKLRQFYPPNDTRIQGLLCSASVFASVELHENGRLKACVLAEDFSADERVWCKGTRVRLALDGRIVEPVASR